MRRSSARSRARTVVAALTLASATFVAIACSVDVDVANKACPCGDDYVCDTSRNVCVLPSELGGVDGSTDGPFIDPDSGLPSCPDDKCPCAKDGDCKDPARARCGPNKICVECQREPADTCPAGSYCNDQNQCTLGCKQESDCQISPAVPHCNTASHQCVECVTASQCSGDAGLLCSPSGSCVEGCDLEAGVQCPTGKTCCENLCLNLQNDVLNCGACGNACSKSNATPSCAGGTCNFQCAQGFGNCNGPANDGCETNLRLPATCGSCGRNCLATVQNADNIGCNGVTGACTFTGCKIGFGNCNGGTNDGCECACGSFSGQICCPGNLCTFPGGKCVGSNPMKCQ